MCVLDDWKPELDLFSVNEEGFEHALTALVPQRPHFSAVSQQQRENIGMIHTVYFICLFLETLGYRLHLRDKYSFMFL